MSKVYKYIVKFNNRVGNTYANRLRDALHDAINIIEYGYAACAHILERQPDGSFKVLTIVD